VVALSRTRTGTRTTHGSTALMDISSSVCTAITNTTFVRSRITPAASLVEMTPLRYCRWAHVLLGTGLVRSTTKVGPYVPGKRTCPAFTRALVNGFTVWNTLDAVPSTAVEVVRRVRKKIGGAALITLSGLLSTATTSSQASIVIRASGYTASKCPINARCMHIDGYTGAVRCYSLEEVFSDTFSIGGIYNPWEDPRDRNKTCTISLPSATTPQVNPYQ